MSSFIATAESNRPDALANAATLTNDGWFPDINLDELRDETKLDSTVTFVRLRSSAVDAMASVNAELGSWQTAQVAAGYADLASVPSLKIGGESVKVTRYERAVYNLVLADITEKYRGYDSTKSGGQKAVELEYTICEARRNVRWALNDIRGIRRCTIELI